MRYYWMALFVMILLGWNLHQDFGLSWDEPIVLMYGQQMMAYFSEGDSSFSTAFDRYHGSFPSLWMAGVDSFFADLPSQKRFFWIRRINFLFFALGGWTLAMLGRKAWGNREGLFLLLIWTLSPRLFADAFYNTKDIPFVALSLLCAWTGIHWVEKKTILRTVLHAAMIALLMNTRILGVLVLVYTVVLGVRNRKDIGYFLLTVVLSTLFLWGLWPILWVQGPMGILYAIEHMSHFPWRGDVLYQGSLTPAQDLPWHYIFVWMGMTIPGLYLILALLAGISKEWKSTSSVLHLWMLLSSLVPVALVIGLGSVMYDGWRHLYFVYPGVLWCAVLGFRALEFRIHRLRYGLWAICVMSVLWIGIRMVQLHPYEMVYFNFLAGDETTLRKRFELDYWGLGFREMLEQVLENDTRETISIGVSNISGMYAKSMLSAEHQDRIRFVGKVEKADYFLTNFRWHPDEYPFPKYFSLVAGNIEIGAIYRISHQEVKE